jgi:hypothetical protein
MGGAFLARADDATAASWNPAGLSYLRLPEISLVGVRNNSETLTKRSTGATAEDSEARGYEPDFLAAAIPFEIGTVSGAAQISFQRVLSLDAQRTTRRANVQIQQAFEGGFDVLAFGTGGRSRSLRLGHVEPLVERPSSNATSRSSTPPHRHRLGFGMELNFARCPQREPTGSSRQDPRGVSPERGARMSSMASSNQLLVSESVRSSYLRRWFRRVVASRSPFIGDYTRTFWSSGRIRNFSRCHSWAT